MRCCGMEGDRFSVKEHVLMPLMALALGALSYWAYTLLASPPPDVTHEMAIPWRALEESAEALGGREFLYADTLKEIKNLKGKKVAFYGYIYPLEPGPKQAHFLLNSQPHICQFHAPSHSGKMVEVFMAEPIAFQMQPVLLIGTFSIPQDKESGINFRLQEAEQIND